MSDWTMNQTQVDQISQSEAKQTNKQAGRRPGIRRVLLVVIKSHPGREEMENQGQWRDLAHSHAKN